MKAFHEYKRYNTAKPTTREIKTPHWEVIPAELAKIGVLPFTKQNDFQLSMKPFTLAHADFISCSEKSSKWPTIDALNCV
mmetsp:Transcript_14291/g.22018  ORF Transcript_14291/g.22018 Transcript_14291/m.22018 type:complete len:80 (+) Transcript_14291:103-342(+)